jgi:hypothetical protein
MSSPLIQLYDAKVGGSVELLPSLRSTWRVNKLAILDRTWNNVSIYRADGIKLRPVPEQLGFPEKNVWSALAGLIYNPTRDIQLRYEEIGPFDLPEVKDKVLDYVSKDDDILTQFLDADEIRELLNRARTFDELVGVIRKIQGNGEAGS